MNGPAQMSDEARRLVGLIGRARMPMSDEKALQGAIEQLFKEHGIAFTRESKVTGGIIDFLVGDVGIEVKIEGPAREVLRQLTRYADDARIKQFVVVAAFPCALPMSIVGKPCVIVDLGRAWL